MISLVLYALQSPFIHHVTTNYEKSVINGITVFVSPEAKSHPETTKPCLELISKATREFLKFTPTATHATLKKTRIWVEHMNPAFPSMCFHESAAWLKEAGFNTDKAGDVEIANPVNAVAWTKLNQPLQIFHEFAHSFHSKSAGFDNKEIVNAYEHAKSTNRYNQVAYNMGGERKAYAMNNPMEYFAELSEAVFGGNDFFPFTRSDLKTFDPQGYQTVMKAWGLKP